MVHSPLAIRTVAPAQGNIGYVENAVEFSALTLSGLMRKTDGVMVGLTQRRDRIASG
jgi:hypothetical protein